MEPIHFGLTGLAVMGQNLARNVARNGFPVVVHNRTTEKMGTAKRPPMKAATTRNWKFRNGATPQTVTSATTDGTNARRNPWMSTRRPRHGAPMAMPMVMAAAMAPAAA